MRGKGICHRMTSFRDKLDAACQANRSLLCVGLDPDPQRMPVSDVFEFNRAVVDATADLVCAYKPNLAFYEALGMRGLEALQRTVEHIRSQAPGVVVIGDAKRGDIGPSGEAYARALFEVWGFDAATANAYGGGDTLKPLLEWPGRGVFIWCRSSNPGAADLQDLPVGDEGVPVYQELAVRAQGWATNGNLGLVLGATYPEELKKVRELCPEVPFLIPGVGAQGGALAEAVSWGTDANGRRAVINSSRGVLYASRDRDFAEAARREASRLRGEINDVLVQEGVGWS